MSTLRLRNLTMLSIEQQGTDLKSFDIAIEEFANKKARKVTVYKTVVFTSEKKGGPHILHFFYYFPYVIFAFC